MRHFVIITQKSVYPQMGPLYLANALLAHGIETLLLPSDAPCEQLDAIIERYDPVAVGCSVMTAPEILDFVRHSIHIQKRYNDNGKVRLPVIWGGMHSTIVWEQTAREPYIDVLVSGEAEITLPRVLNDIIKGKMPQKLMMVETPSELDKFHPHWGADDISKYLFPESRSVHAHVEFKKENIFYYLLTSRGCTYKCNFCWEVARTTTLKAESMSQGSDHDLTWRSHSYAWVEHELDYLEKRLAKEGHAIDGVGFWDDMIFGKQRIAHIERAKEIFKSMRKRNFGYLLEARANQLIMTTDRWNDNGENREADLYKFLKETGCMQVFVGTESASQETLNLIQKGTKAADYRRLVELSREVQLPLRFSMIVGFPGESEKSIHQTLDFIEELEPEPYISVSGPKLFTPYPGTPQYDAAVRRGMRIPQTTLDWARLNRYSDYRKLFPWLVEDYAPATLYRIDSFFEKVSKEKRKQVDEEAIYELIRSH